MILRLGLLGFLLFGAGQTAVDAPLTEDGLRAWLVSGGVLESNQRLIHEQFSQQRMQLPPWWPSDVADQEEAAVQSVDMVPVALPFYQFCMTEREVRLIVKFSGTTAGKRVTSSAVGTHERAAGSGSSATDAQESGEQAADVTVKNLSAKEKHDAVAALTPQERAFDATHFTPDRMSIYKKCTDSAYAQTVAEAGKLQMAAVEAVIEKNRPALVAARTAWMKDHPQSQ